jgi:hypothetical protein
MSGQTASVQYPADIGTRSRFRVRLRWLWPVFLALIYPFVLDAFHAAITPVIGGHSAHPAPLIAAAIAALLLAFGIPVAALVTAMRLGETADPSLAQRRARGAALLAVAAPTLFVFLGVVLYMLHDPVPDRWVWVAFWIAAAAYLAFSDASAVTAAPPRPAMRLRVAHGISALAIIVLFLAMHLGNHLTFVLGEPTYRAVMKAVRHVYRAEAIQPVVVALFLFQVGSGVFLATRAAGHPIDRFRTFQIGSGIYLAAYVLGHMNSVFVFARLYLGIDSDWAFATGAPAGLVKDAWNIRLVPHYGLGVFFVLAHLAAGARMVMLSHGVRRAYADRFMVGAATLAGLVALVAMFGACGGRLGFALP